jgi:hypothetical protein
MSRFSSRKSPFTEKSSPTSAEPQTATTPLYGIDMGVLRAHVVGRFEYVDLEFGSAHSPLTISHTMAVPSGIPIRVIPVEWQFRTPPIEAPVIYRDIAGTAKADGAGYIVRKCNVGLARCRALLIVEPSEVNDAA